MLEHFGLFICNLAPCEKCYTWGGGDGAKEEEEEGGGEEALQAAARALTRDRTRHEAAGWKVVTSLKRT